MGMQLTIQELSYYAGFFDGEGSVLIYKRTAPLNYPRKEGGRSGIGLTVPYQIRATVTNTNREIVMSFKHCFGGCVTAYVPTHHRRAAWKWTVQCQLAATFYRAILPFLRQKRLEVDLALVMQDTIDQFKHRGRPKGRKGQLPLPPEEIAYRDNIHARLMDLRKPIYLN